MSLPNFMVMPAAALMALFLVATPTLRGADQPDDRWLHAYVLVQTGHELAEEEVWPLAMANYSAALEQFEGLAEDFPGFQPRLVNYRRADLKERIELANESMNAGEHDLAMTYEDIIETSRIGAASRYRLDYETSYQYLVRARWQMEDLLKRSSEKVVAALAKQQAFIEEITEASRESLIRLPDGALKVHNIEKDFAARVEIAMSELPSYQAPAAAESGMSSALFPDGLVAQARAEWYR